MHLLALALTLLWVAQSDALRYGCYALVGLIVLLVLLAALFGWPIAVAVAAGVLINAGRDAASPTPPTGRR